MGDVARRPTFVGSTDTGNTNHVAVGGTPGHPLTSFEADILLTQLQQREELEELRYRKLTKDIADITELLKIHSRRLDNSMRQPKDQDLWEIVMHITQNFWRKIQELCRKTGVFPLMWHHVVEHLIDEKPPHNPMITV